MSYTRRGLLAAAGAGGTLAGALGASLLAVGSLPDPKPLASTDVRLVDDGPGTEAELISAGWTVLPLGGRDPSFVHGTLRRGSVERSVWLRVVRSGRQVGFVGDPTAEPYPVAQGIVGRRIAGARHRVVCDGDRGRVRLPRHAASYLVSPDRVEDYEGGPVPKRLVPATGTVRVGTAVFGRDYRQYGAYDPFADAPDGVATKC